MDHLFHPQSLVVIGVSENPDNLPRIIAENIFRYQYRGDVYLYGRKKGNIDGHEILDSFEALQDGIELAIILTPAATVPAMVEACGKKGIQTAIIETGGFAETSASGEALGQEVLAIARRYQMRLVGPNCVGIVSSAEGINSIFVKMEPEEIRAGQVSLLAQSGAVTLTMLDMLASCGLGISKAVSVGNKLDYNEADYLSYFLDDPETRVPMMYLEGISDGRRLIELAGEGRKPIVVFKSNTSQASAHAAYSHTAALTNDDAIVSAACKQFGITRAKTFREMGILAKGFHLPPVRGSRLAVFTRSGGHGIVATDMAAELKFDLTPYPDSLIESAKKYFRADIIDVSNPLDLGTVFNFDSYIPLVRECIDAIHPDAVLFIYVFCKDDIETAERITAGFQELSRETGLPIALYYSTIDENIRKLEDRFEYPIFTEVYEAMLALAANRDFTIYQLETLPRRAKLSSSKKTSNGAAAKARKVLDNHDSVNLLSSQALEICHIYGIPVSPWALAATPRDAVYQALRIGYPLALKIISPEASHKSDIGGVILNIQNEADLQQALERMQANTAAHGIVLGRFLLQKMAEEGHEVILGAKRDAAFGPVVLFGLGGIYVEALNDVALRVAPIDKVEALAMINEIKAACILKGMRGKTPADLDAIADALVRLSQMIVDLPEIAEIDINPLIASEHGVITVDARMLLAPATST